MSIDPDGLVTERRARLHDTMTAAGVKALLTADPFSIRYATGTRNMLVHGLTGPDRLALVIADGPTILWEFGGCEHVTAAARHVDEFREAPPLSAKKRIDPAAAITEFAAEIGALLDASGSSTASLAIDRLEVPVVDALRARGVTTTDGVVVMQQAMAIKQPSEVTAMRRAVVATEEATRALEAAVAPGRTEQEVWAEFFRSLVAGGGELVVTRLLQAGVRTFPYFQEASEHVMTDGDLVCFDTDAVAVGGYSVDFSRTFLCGSGAPTERQRALYRLARAQLRHNAANLRPGRTFEEFAALAFDVPEPYVRYGYYQLAHGLGLAGGHPNVPRLGEEPYPLPGTIEPGMVICVESYVGDPETRQGVKLEDQFVIHDNDVESMSTYRFDDRLGSE